MVRIGQEIQCLPYAGFLMSVFAVSITASKTLSTIYVFNKTASV